MATIDNKLVDKNIYYKLQGEEHSILFASTYAMNAGEEAVHDTTMVADSGLTA